MPNLALSLCLIALSTFLREDLPAKPLSPFPLGFSFVGSWSCSGTFRVNKTHRATFKGAVALGGKWLNLTEDDTEPATGYEASYWIGYDSQQHQLVEFDANTFGAARYRSLHGWQAGVLTMESDEAASSKDDSKADRFVYSITSAHEFTVDWQVRRQNATEWQTADHLTCKASETA